MGRSLIILGVLLIIAGVLFTLGDRLPFRIGRLPGDIVVKGKNTTFYFPLMTSIILSVVLTLAMWFFSRR
jgi:hypothetical protein